MHFRQTRLMAKVQSVTFCKVIIFSLMQVVIVLKYRMSINGRYIKCEFYITKPTTKETICFLSLIVSAMFGATFNSVTRIRLQTIAIFGTLKGGIYIYTLYSNLSFSLNIVVSQQLFQLQKHLPKWRQGFVKKQLNIFVKKLMILGSLDHSIQISAAYGPNT